VASIPIGGEEFGVLVEGSESRPTLMLSNPLGTNFRFWDPQAPALREHFRIVRYDSRGHGKTSADHGPYAIDQLGHDALAIADALGISKFHWLGLSMGSTVGLWLLSHAPNRIGRAVLAGTAAQMPDPDMWNSRIHSVRNFGMEKTAEAAAERWFTKEFRYAEPAKVERVLAMVRATAVQGYAAACAALRDMDLREAIRGITNEVLVIAGRHDLSTPPAMGALVASAIKGAKLVTLEAPHLSNIEDEGNFTKAVLDFLTAPESVRTKAPSRARKAAKKAAPRQRPAKKPAGKKVAVKKTRIKAAAAKKASKGFKRTARKQKR
jgi:3-oxoadipate enol-lactonase